MKNTFKKLEIITLMAVVGILVMGCATAKITSVDWKTLKGPKQARQYVEITTAEVTVVANYEDGESKEVKVKSLKYDKDKVGVQTVTVNLGSETGTFQTEVMELTGIRVAPPTKTIYYVDEKLDTKGLKIFGLWKNMTEQELSWALSLNALQSGFDSKTPAAKRDVTYTFRGKTATFPVTIVPALTDQQIRTAATFTPEPKQPLPVGTWAYPPVQVWMTVYNVNITINANGTAQRVMRPAMVAGQPPESFTWFVAGGNMLVLLQDTGANSTHIYSIENNKLKWIATDGSLVELTRVN